MVSPVRVKVKVLALGLRVNVTVSLPSTRASLVGVMVTVLLVWPAGMMALVPTLPEAV